MAFQILLNVVLALVWMFLSHSYNPSSFIVGYLLGILLLLGFRRFFNSRFYLIRVWAVIKLFFLFIKELKTELKNPWEITLLANLITLTPGTLVIDVSDDNKTLYIHAMDINDVQSDIDAIKNSFEKAIMEVSR